MNRETRCSLRKKGDEKKTRDVSALATPSFHHLRRARPSAASALVQLLRCRQREDEHRRLRKDGLARAAARQHRDRPGHC